MSKKIYKVEFCYDIFVLAENSGEAEEIAKQHVEKSSNDYPYDLEINNCVEIKNNQEISEYWKNGYPYVKEDDERSEQFTLEEWLKIL